MHNICLRLTESAPGRKIGERRLAESRCHAGSISDGEASCWLGEVRVMVSPIADVVLKLEARAASFVKENRLPGAAVGVVHGDELVWSAGIGFADVASQRPTDDATLYRVASITKTFTGTAILQLRDEGLLHLDDPAVVYVPELRGASSPFGDIETVTIRRILSHESGLVSEPPGTNWMTPTYEGVAERNLARVAEIGTRIPPNVQQKYSNLGYQLLGEIVARLSGLPYVEYVRASILDPLDMAGSVFEPLPRNSTRVARPDTRAGSCRTSWIWHPSLRGYGRRAACGRASRTSPAGSRSSSTRTADRAMAPRSSPATR